LQVLELLRSSGTKKKKGGDSVLGLFGIDVRKEEGREKLRRAGRASLKTGVVLLAASFAISCMASLDSPAFDLSMTLAMIATPFVVFAAYANSVLRRVANVRNS